MVVKISHLGQYWSATHGAVRALGVVEFDGSSGALEGRAIDLSEEFPFEDYRGRFRERFGSSPIGKALTTAIPSWKTPADRYLQTYSTLPFPCVELAEWLDGHALSPMSLLEGSGSKAKLDLASLDRDPHPDHDHLVAPIIPRRALAFGVTYLNSALEREAEGERSDYAYVYRAVKERGERPELFLKATSPEQIVGPRGKMALRSDLTNSVSLEGEPTERLTVQAGIEPELAAVVSSTGRIWGYTLANDVSGNRIENETLLYLTQAKYFTGSLVLGPLIWLSDEQGNPDLEIRTRIRKAGELLFERRSTSANINTALSELIAQAHSHIRLGSGEVFSTGTDVVPDGIVKVLDEDMEVEIFSERIGPLRHGAAFLERDGSPNLDYSRLELERAGLA